MMHRLVRLLSCLAFTVSVPSYAGSCDRYRLSGLGAAKLNDAMLVQNFEAQRRTFVCMPVNGTTKCTIVDDGDPFNNEAETA